MSSKENEVLLITLTNGAGVVFINQTRAYALDAAHEGMSPATVADQIAAGLGGSVETIEFSTEVGEGLTWDELYDLATRAREAQANAAWASQFRPQHTGNGFLWNGKEITNPTVACEGEISRLATPKEYGFWFYHGGGSLTSWRLNCQDGYYLLLTDLYGANPPSEKIGHVFRMGLCDSNNDIVWIRTLLFGVSTEEQADYLDRLVSDMLDETVLRLQASLGIESFVEFSEHFESDAWKVGAIQSKNTLMDYVNAVLSHHSKAEILAA